MHIYGHERVLAELEKNFYNTILLTGPEHVGKSTLAMHIGHAHGLPTDLYNVAPLSAIWARYLVSTAQYTTNKAYVIDLSHASERVQNILLKALEEVHPTNMFIIISTTPLLPTIVSRMQVAVPLGLLSPYDVQSILRERGVPKEAAEQASSLSQGTLHKPIYNSSEEHNHVVRALKAINDHDASALSALAVKWTDDTTEYLKMWCVEAISGNWKFFSPEDSMFSGSQMPLAILIAVSKNVRPKLVVRASLMGLL